MTQDDLADIISAGQQHVRARITDILVSGFNAGRTDHLETAGTFTGLLEAMRALEIAKAANEQPPIRAADESGAGTGDPEKS